MYCYFVYIGPEFVLVADPEAVKQIVVTNCHKYQRSALFKTYFPLAENGLFSAIGREHSRQKKVIAPAFNIGNLKGLVDVFRRKTELLIKVCILSVHCKNELRMCSGVGSHIIWDVTFGYTN